MIPNKTKAAHGGRREGSGRKPKGEKIEFKLTPEQKAEIAEKAKQRNMTITDYILSKIFTV